VLVCEQGFGVFSFVYEGLFASLTAAGFRVLAFDFYGFGFSEAALGVAYNAELFCTQAHELLAYLGVVGPVHLLGHSMGGLLAAIFAVRACAALLCTNPRDRSSRRRHCRLVAAVAIPRAGEVAGAGVACWNSRCVSSVASLPAPLARPRRCYRTASSQCATRSVAPFTCPPSTRWRGWLSCRSSEASSSGMSLCLPLSVARAVRRRRHVVLVCFRRGQNRREAAPPASRRAAAHEEQAQCLVCVAVASKLVAETVREVHRMDTGLCAVHGGVV
jgi:pimeloyl-ACP methyl ester carboxylesterase